MFFSDSPQTKAKVARNKHNGKSVSYKLDLDWAEGLGHNNLDLIREHLSNVDHVARIRRERAEAKKRRTMKPLTRAEFVGWSDDHSEVARQVPVYTRTAITNELDRLKDWLKAVTKGWRSGPTNQQGERFARFDQEAQRIARDARADDLFRLYHLKPVQAKAQLKPEVKNVWVIEGCNPPTSRYDQAEFWLDNVLYTWANWSGRAFDKLGKTEEEFLHSSILNRSGNEVAYIDWIPEPTRAAALDDVTQLIREGATVLFCPDKRARTLFLEAKALAFETAQEFAKVREEYAKV